MSSIHSSMTSRLSMRRSRQQGTQACSTSTPPPPTSAATCLPDFTNLASSPSRRPICLCQSCGIVMFSCLVVGICVCPELSQAHGRWTKKGRAGKLGGWRRRRWWGSQCPPVIRLMRASRNEKSVFDQEGARGRTILLEFLHVETWLCRWLRIHGVGIAEVVEAGGRSGGARAAAEV